MSTMNVSSSFQVTQESWENFSLTQSPVVAEPPSRFLHHFQVTFNDQTTTLSYHFKQANSEKQQKIKRALNKAFLSICKEEGSIPESPYKSYFAKFSNLPRFEQITALFAADVRYVNPHLLSLDTKETPITHHVVNNKKLGRNQILYIISDFISTGMQPDQKDSNGFMMDQLPRAKELKIARSLERFRKMPPSTHTTIPLRYPDLFSYIIEQSKTEPNQSEIVLLIGPGRLDAAFLPYIEMDSISKEQVFGVSPQLIETLIGYNQNTKIAVLDNSSHLFQKIRINSKCFDRYFELIKFHNHQFKSEDLSEMILKTIGPKIGDLKNESREKKLQHRVQYLLRDATSLEFYLKNTNKFSYIIATNVFLYNRFNKNLFGAMVQSLKKNGQLIIDAMSLSWFLPELSESALDELISKMPIASYKSLRFPASNFANKNMSDIEQVLRLRNNRRFFIACCPNSGLQDLSISASVSPLFIFKKT